MTTAPRQTRRAGPGEVAWGSVTLVPMTNSSPVESVDRALLVLEALAAAGPAGMGLAELASRLGVNKTTVHRALAALRFRDFVSQDPVSGTYVLGGAATALGEAFFGEENLPALLHPALVALCAEVGELVHLGVLTGSQVVYVDKVEPERAVRVWSAVGRRMPAATTALGRAMLAQRGASRDVVNRYVEVAGSDASADDVWAEVERARERGWAREVEENEPGIACVGAAVLRAGVAVAAVSVTAPVERMGEARFAEIYARMGAVLPPLLPASFSLG